MSNSPFFPYRDEVEHYLRSCEYLLAASAITEPFSKEERVMMGYYVTEIQNLLALSPQKEGLFPFPEPSSRGVVCLITANPYREEYMCTCEALLKIGELSDNEVEVLEEMLYRIGDKLLNNGKS